jgi:hypothetical protein
MLQTLKQALSKPTSHNEALYKLGCVIGMFDQPYDSYKHIFESEDNEICQCLTFILADLSRRGMTYSSTADSVVWNESFKVDSYLEAVKRKKEDRARQQKVLTEAKKILRKYVSTGMIIGDDWLQVKVVSVDYDLLEIKAIVQKATQEWEKVFAVGHTSVWKYINSFGNQIVFQTDSPGDEPGTGAQNLLCIEDGNLVFDRDM